ncbi:DUF1741-domain-containing protein [Saitoella complicata NRRL Y-17804]|uniref:Armadillo-like helical domain-containing protein n=1 Tax=Saitoella complicata (strain BCRC 22490 / CBS 7301 / JCM 7358 / NBRC 10748 / NRRL Y-17804) TaxID=698492 RepID=A0A0E9NDQ8_SAICN|nr:DUF1741-domain-containing protein [Saitoella complicata NRRL Y-17804]ODQ50725.1 DUF1741-domain-containing protein [Saitoella complicata NRRL Y-17804]GAO47987.1 hypothetical protein G7K_2177-t1 [Saitoella complicata NRRL Y-17804]
MDPAVYYGQFVYGIDDPDILDDTFYHNLFSVKYDHTALSTILRRDIGRIEHITQSIFTNAVHTVSSPTSSTEQCSNAIDTLRTLIQSTISGKRSYDSSAIITTLTSLSDVDTVLPTFVTSLQHLISQHSHDEELATKAVALALCFVARAYHSSLISYFTHRNFLPPLLSYITSRPSSSPAAGTRDAVLLVGLLAAYQKFESHNPYQTYLSQLSDQEQMMAVIETFGEVCREVRDDYIEVQDDGEGVGFVGWMGSWWGGAKLVERRQSKAKGIVDVEEAWGVLPGPEVAVLLAVYEFVQNSKVFCMNFIRAPPTAPNTESPFSLFLSLTSYLLSHQRRSPHAATSSRLTTLILRILLDDPGTASLLALQSSSVRLCRQRTPLPKLGGMGEERVVMGVVFDLCVQGLEWNLKKRLDVEGYVNVVGLVGRGISVLKRGRTRIAYHWHHLWKSLFGLVKFMTARADDLKDLTRVKTLTESLSKVLALALSSGESFLPSAKEYDDLFYQVIQSGHLLTQFSQTYNLTTYPPTTLLLAVHAHYLSLIESHQLRTGEHLDAEEVHRVIRDGYGGLEVKGGGEGLEVWERWREGEERVFLKGVGRGVVGDVIEIDERAH